MLIHPPSCPHDFKLISIPSHHSHMPQSRNLTPSCLCSLTTTWGWSCFVTKSLNHSGETISVPVHITYIAEQQDVDWPRWMNKLLCSFFSRNLVHRDPMGWKVSCASWAKRRLLGYFPKLQVSILSRRERESCPQSSFCSNLPWIRSQGSEDDDIAINHS